MQSTVTINRGNDNICVSNCPGKPRSRTNNFGINWQQGDDNIVYKKSSKANTDVEQLGKGGGSNAGIIVTRNTV